MLSDPNFYYLACPIILLVGASKGGFGGGLGLLAVPILSLMVDPRFAAALMLPILCAMDLVGLYKFRLVWDRQLIGALLPGALVGTVFGALSFEIINADLLRASIGIIALCFASFYLFQEYSNIKSNTKNLTTKENTDKHKVANSKSLNYQGTFWGAITGFTSYIAHAGGPPMTIFLLLQKLPKSKFVSTTIVFFAAINFIKLIPYITLGQISKTSLMTSLVLLPLAPIGVLIGIALHRRIPEKVFFRITYILLLFAGLKLCYEAFF